MNNSLQQLKRIVAKTFRKAKRWYATYLACQIAVLVFAVVSIFAQLNPNLSALFAFLGVLATECFRWRSDWWKSEGESAKRKWEIVDGLGIAVDSRDVADWLAARPSGFLDDLTTDEIRGSEFDSGQPAGPLRVLENTQESAWWSKHLSRRMVVCLCALLLLVVIGAFAALTISIGELKAANLQRSGAVVQNVGGIICAVLMFVFSVNLIRLLADFAAFASIAEDILRRTADLKRPTVEERDALSLMHDYQTARNSAPLLPTFIWHLNGEHLREQWALFRPKGKQLNSP
jgi:hypothetical protein